MAEIYDKIVLRAPLNPLNSAFDPPRPNSLFDEGIYVSAPDFFNEYNKSERPSGAERPLKLQITYQKYWQRSCSRCTPFATFAGVTVVNVTDDPTNIVLTDNANHIKKARIDMLFLCELVNEISKTPEIREKLKFISNNSIYRTKDEIRYIEYEVKDFARTYRLSSVVRSSHLDKIIEMTDTGAYYSDLVQTLVREEKVTDEEAEEFISDLVNSQLIISELEPCLTGSDPLATLVAKLSHISSELFEKLSAINLVLNKSDLRLEDIQRIEKQLKELINNKDLVKDTLQIDLHLSTESNNIHRSLVKEIVNQANDLMALSIPFQYPDMDNFVNLFKLKFQDEEVPLQIALDSELGIGFGSSNINSFSEPKTIRGIPNALGDKNQIWSQTSFVQKFALSKFLQCLKEDGKEITITESDIKELIKYQKNNRKFSSYFLYGSLHKSKEKSFQFDLSVVGLPSGANLITRFATQNSGIFDLTQQICDYEQHQNECVYAEIVHLPHSRLGNVSLRPLLRKYEIPLATFSGAPPEGIIPLEDLYIKVIGKEIILKSKKLGRRVIPCLTTAHDFEINSIPIYRFLCELQHYGHSYPKLWDWSLVQSDYFPRVSYKNIIIKRACWKISEDEFGQFPEEPAKLLDIVNSVRVLRKIPQRVVFGNQGDELLIDFSKELSVIIFSQIIRKNKVIDVTEFIYNEENCIVRDNEGNSFTNELIIPFRLSDSKRIDHFTKVGYSSDTISEPIKRKFTPNEEWTFIKVYCSPKFGEYLLRTYIREFVNSNFDAKRLEKFFFIRYQDDFYHLRIRFFNSEIQKNQPLINDFISGLNEYVKDGQIQKVAIDTYERELERYFFQSVSQMETIFFYDSISTLEYLELSTLSDDPDLHRLIFALRGIDNLLSDFSISDSQKSDLLKELSNGFCHEFGIESLGKKELDRKYRDVQLLIAAYMNPDKDAENDFLKESEILKKRSYCCANLIFGLEQVNGSDKSELLKSLIHMSMNRLFVAHQRKHELVVYYFLEKFYYSKLAIARK